MEASKIKVGGEYAFRTSTRASRWGNDYRQPVKVTKVVAAVTRGGYSTERRLCDEHGVSRVYGLVAGKTLFVCQYLDGDGNPKENTSPFITSGACLTSTWAGHQEATRAAEAAKAERIEAQRQASEKRDALNEGATLFLLKLNDDLVNVLAMDGCPQHTEPVEYNDDFRVSISYRDLRVLVDNAIEVAGGAA